MKEYFYFDIQECSNKNVLTLHSKALNNNETVCFTIYNINRKAYVAIKNNCDEKDAIKELYDSILKKLRISKDLITIEVKEMGYWFENIPNFNKGKYKFIVIEYPYKFGEINISVDNKFKYLLQSFGSGESIVKRFMIENKLAGYGRFKIDEKHLKLCNKQQFKLTNTKEYIIGDPSHIKFIDLIQDDQIVISESKTTKQLASYFKSLNIASIRIKTIYNFNEYKNEIIAILLNNTLFVRKIDGLFWEKPENTQNKYFNTECDMIKSFISHFSEMDPDIILGHRILNDDMQFILDRCNKFKISKSSLCRMKNMKSNVINIIKGRLVCDVWDFGCSKDNVKGLKLNTIQEMSNKLLNTEYKDTELSITYSSFRNYVYYTEDNGLSILRKEMETERDLCERIQERLSILDISKKVSKYTGCRLSDSLIKGKSVISEYLLLHKFNANNFVPPDVTRFNSKKRNHEEMHKNIPNYSGGLVLEPKIGIYNTICMLLDYKSLYPSIASAEKIGFSSISSERFLCDFFSFLINKRDEVKVMVKEPGDNADILQYVLKIIANSLYGVLGMPSFRFCSINIAENITTTGRKLLKLAVDVSENKHIKVIYGHTDSIKIDTGTNDEDEANRISNQILSIINNKHQNIHMKLEAVYSNCIIFKKTKYASKKINCDEIDYKGTAITSTNTPTIVSDIGKLIISQLFTYDPSKNIHKFAKHISNIVYEFEDSLKQKDFKDFVLTTKLGIDRYKLLKKSERDTTSLPPHIKVAIWMNKNGILVKKNDPIQYIICRNVTNHSMQDYVHPFCYIKTEFDMEIDFTYYSKYRIRPLVKRLCEPIKNLSNLLFIGESKRKKM